MDRHDIFYYICRTFGLLKTWQENYRVLMKKSLEPSQTKQKYKGKNKEEIVEILLTDKLGAKSVRTVKWLIFSSST